MSSTDVDRVVYGRIGRLSYAGITHPGLVRRRNEDTFWVDEVKSLFLVADGMGGQRRGAEAARSAVTTLARAFEKERRSFIRFLPASLGLRLAMSRAYLAANQAVKAAAAGGGTTLDTVLFHGDRAHIAHVGDGRVYLCHAGALHQLTRDHTVGTEKVKRQTPHDEGDPDDEQAVTRALGGSVADARPDQMSVALTSGDFFLLCSDGLSGLVPFSRVETTLADRGEEPMALCRRLVSEALRAGGTDNVTALLVQRLP